MNNLRSDQCSDSTLYSTFGSPFTIKELTTAISKLSISTASGPDLIAYLLLTHLSPFSSATSLHLQLFLVFPHLPLMLETRYHYPHKQTWQTCPLSSLSSNLSHLLCIQTLRAPSSQSGPLRGWTGPGTRNNSGLPTNQIQFFVMRKFYGTGFFNAS